MAGCADAARTLAARLAVTTIHLVERFRNVGAANEAVDWLIRHFDIAAIGRDQLLRARSLGWPNFEDAVVAAAAESAGWQEPIPPSLAVGGCGG